MKYLSFCLLLIISLVSCENDSKTEDDISKVKVELKIDRFDKAFSKVNTENWKALREVYPFMFSNAYPDSFWENKIQDTLQHELSEEVLKVYPDMTAVEPELLSLFQHLKYYYPEFRTPRIVTTTSYVDYRNKVIVTDSIDLIALDTYFRAGA
ncbi:hypothetical protein [Formosa sp. S-31]|uniref:gliding motility protein GldB-related protein n=1 Tax=Formosa sp. S-31 TaxID=2790949 RepID=UPI003EBC63A1